MTETALDLSKHTFDCRSVSESPSPVSSPRHHGSTRSESVSSDDMGGASSPAISCVRPIPGPIPSNHIKVETEESKINKQMDRVAPIRPFKMYPMEQLNMFNAANVTNSVVTSPGLSSPLSGLSSPLYESSLPPLALTPLTSHLLQRKRRQDNRGEAECKDKKLVPVPENKKDTAYWDRRRKNNEAAKRSRDTRRHKEEEIAMRAAFLEQENLKLRAQVAILKNETAKLHYMLYNRM